MTVESLPSRIRPAVSACHAVGAMGHFFMLFGVLFVDPTSLWRRSDAYLSKVVDAKQYRLCRLGAVALAERSIRLMQLKFGAQLYKSTSKNEASTLKSETASYLARQNN